MPVSKCQAVGIDNTMINGIKLICTKIGENNFQQKEPMSLVGKYGDWDSGFYCDPGTIIGFKLRSAKYPPIGIDNLGAINLAVLCAMPGSQKTWLEGDGVDVLRRGQREKFFPMIAMKNAKPFFKLEFHGTRLPEPGAGPAPGTAPF